MKSILLTSTALLLAGGLAVVPARAQDAVCPEDIDAFTRSYEEAMAGAGGGEALSTSEQAELFGLRTTAENLFRAGNLELCAEAITRARLLLETAIAPSVILPGALVGMEVQNAAGDTLGEVEDVALDPISGRIAYVLVDHGGFLGLGGGLYPVPWRAVTWVPGGEHLLLDMDEERLENAPEHVEDDVPAQDRRAWLLSVHDYYGVEPFWQDNIASMSVGAGAGVVGAELTATGAGEPAAGTKEGTGGTQAEPPQGSDSTTTGASDAGTSAQPAADATARSDTGPTAHAPAADTAPVVIAPAPTASSGGADAEAVAELRSRLDEMESRLAKLSQQAPGEELSETVATLEARVEEVAGAMPGEELPQAIAELREQVGSLSGQAEALAAQAEALAAREPGEDLRETVAALETRVEEVAGSMPGEELPQAIAELREQVGALSGQAGALAAQAEALAGREPGDDLRATVAELETRVQEMADGGPGQDVSRAVSVLEARVAELAAAVPGPELRETVERMQAELRQLSAGASGQGVQGAAPVIEASPGISSDTTAIGTAPAPAQPAAIGVAPAAGDSPAPAEPAAADSEPAPGAAATGQGGAPAGVEPSADTSADTSAGTAAAPAEPAQQEAAEPAQQEGAGRATEPATSAPAGEGDALESCEAAIALLEEDIASAEGEGLDVAEARNELLSAQAMMRLNSEALCRAAVKRARDDLVAQGFEPRTAN